MVCSSCLDCTTVYHFVRCDKYDRLSMHESVYTPKCRRFPVGKRSSFLILLIVLSVVVVGQLYADDPTSFPTVNGFDSKLMFPYSEPLSITSDVTQYISFFAPAAFAFVAPPSEWLEISLLYGTSALLSFGTRTLMKKTIERIRPYEYFPDSPEQPPWGRTTMTNPFPRDTR